MCQAKKRRDEEERVPEEIEAAPPGMEDEPQVEEENMAEFLLEQVAQRPDNVRQFLEAGQFGEEVRDAFENMVQLQAEHARGLEELLGLELDFGEEIDQRREAAQVEEDEGLDEEEELDGAEQEEVEELEDEGGLDEEERDNEEEKQEKEDELEEEKDLDEQEQEEEEEEKGAEPADKRQKLE